MEGLTLCRDGRRKTLLANLTPQTQNARAAWGGSPARLRVLDAATARDCMTRPAAFEGGGRVTVGDDGLISVVLPPFAVAVLEECL